VKPALTPEAMLADMRLHARSSVVHVEPTTVAEWRECIGHVLCGAAFDVGLAQVRADRAEVGAGIRCFGVSSRSLMETGIDPTPGRLYRCVLPAQHAGLCLFGDEVKP